MRRQWWPQPQLRQLPQHHKTNLHRFQQPLNVAGAGAVDAAEEEALTLEEVEEPTTTTVKIHLKILQIKNPTKRDPGPVRMSQTMRVLVTGRKGELRLTAPTPWSAAGSTSWLPENEMLASLDLKIQKISMIHYTAV